MDQGKKGAEKGSGGSQDPPNAADTASFSSILASVAKMREESGGGLIGGNSSPRNTVSANSDNKSGNGQSQPPQGFQTARQVANTQNRNTPLPPQRIIRSRPADNARYEASRHANLSKKRFHSIQVNKNQNGNPLLTHLKQVSYEFNGRIRDVDYLVNSHCVVTFISLKYHKLHPEYVYHRIKKITYNPKDPRMLRILMVLVDVDNPDDSMRELNKLALFNNMTLVTSWSFEQCADYLTALKQSEQNMGQSLIQGNSKRNDDMSDDTNFDRRAVDTLTTVRTINKSDTANLISKFGTIGKVFTLANEANLAEVQGMGKQKVKQLMEVINEPFVYKE